VYRVLSIPLNYSLLFSSKTLIDNNLLKPYIETTYWFTCLNHFIVERELISEFSSETSINVRDNQPLSKPTRVWDKSWRIMRHFYWDNLWDSIPQTYSLFWNSEVKHWSLWDNQLRGKSWKIMGVVKHNNYTCRYMYEGLRLFRFNYQIYTRPTWWQKFIENVYQTLTKL